MTARTLAVHGLAPLARTYDVAGRLHALGYVDGYDRQGTITALTSWALTTANQHGHARPHGPWIDRLAYHYTPGTNRLSAIVDATHG